MSFYPGQQVAYIPNHADGPEHPAAERGFVTSVGNGVVFCRFFRPGSATETTLLNSQGCFPKNLQPYEHVDQAIVDQIMARIGSSE